MSDDTPDLNAIAAYVLAHELSSLRDAAKAIITRAGRHISGKVDKAMAAYLEWAIRKHTYVKPFLTPTRRRPLHEVYVDVPLRSDDRMIDAPDAITFCTGGTRALLVGGAGSGKTTLVQHLVSSAIAAEWQFPVVVRLRDLHRPVTDRTEGRRDPGLIGYLHRLLIHAGADITGDELHELLVSGSFVFLLDGADEVTPSDRAYVRGQVADLLQYRFNDVVMTSRPGEGFREWTSWDQYQVCGIAKQDAAKLVGRSEYGDDLGKLKSFLNLLETQLYESHYAFASNPLLLSLMYMSFYAYGDIPKQLCSFYSKAFGVLWDKHDAAKEGTFARERHSALNEMQFVALLEAVAIQAQLQARFEFDPEQLSAYIARASESEGICVRSDAFRRDLIESMTLLIEDGLVDRFIHRSFQEYFAARYLHRTSPKRRRAFGKVLMIRATEDQILRLLGEQNASYLEGDILVPAAAAVTTALMAPTPALAYSLYLTHMVESVRVEKGRVWVRCNARMANTVSCIMMYIDGPWPTLARQDKGAGHGGAKAATLRAGQGRGVAFSRALCEAQWPERSPEEISRIIQQNPVDIEVEHLVEIAPAHQGALALCNPLLAESGFGRAMACIAQLNDQYRARQQREGGLVSDAELSKLMRGIEE